VSPLYYTPSEKRKEVTEEKRTQGRSSDRSERGDEEEER